MATERRRQRTRKKPKSKRTTLGRKPAAAGPTTVHGVPDHLLELILLHLHSSACLLRAAATCKRWRRLVAETGFLTRFRSLNAPCITDNYHAVDPNWVEVEHGQPPQITGNPVFVLSPSLTVDRRHFSLDFLPDSDTAWEIADSRGSLLLVFKRRATSSSWASRARRRSHFCFPDLVVCEPLTRRYQGILRPTDTTTTTTCCLGVFLLDGDHVDSTGGRIGMSNFRIVSVLNECNASAEPSHGTPVACVFSSASDDGGWRVLPKKARNSVVTIPEPDAIDSISFVGRANGSIYWVMTGEDRAMLAFEEDTAEFSRFLFPAGSIFWGPYVDRRSFQIIGGEDGALRVIRVIGDDLNIFVRLQHEWVVEKLVRLSEATRGLLPGREEGRYIHFHLEAMIVAANEKFVLMTPQGKTWPFSVDLETMEVEREHERNRYPGPAYPCELPWPPALETCVADANGSSRRRR